MVPLMSQEDDRVVEGVNFFLVRKGIDRWINL